MANKSCAAHVGGLWTAFQKYTVFRSTSMAGVKQYLISSMLEFFVHSEIFQLAYSVPRICRFYNIVHLDNACLP